MKRSFILRTMMVMAAALAAAPAAGQALPDAEGGYLVVLEPREWTGTGTRGITRGRAVRVAGLAHHASGIRQVSINGVPAILRRDGSGAMRFDGRLAAAALERDVEIVMYPVAGDPIARVQRPDGTFTTGPATGAAGPVNPLARHERSSDLRVSLHGLPENARRAVTASLARAPGVVPSVPGVPAHLTVVADGSTFVVLGADASERHRVAAPTVDEGAAALIPVLEQELGAVQLELLPAPAQPLGLSVAFPGGHRFAEGGAIEFSVRPGVDGYLTILDLGTDGTVSVLYPSDVDDPQVQGGEALALPSAQLRTVTHPDAPYTASRPYGRGVVRAFLTPRPLALTTDDEGRVPAETVLRALRAATTEGGRTLPWGAASLEYFITP
jgi:hypothetical protein